MQREMHAEIAEYTLNILALKSIDPTSKRFGIYPLSFCFPKKKAPKKKGTLKYAARCTFRAAPAFEWGQRATQMLRRSSELHRALTFSAGSIYFNRLFIKHHLHEDLNAYWYSCKFGTVSTGTVWIYWIQESMPFFKTKTFKTFCRSCCYLTVRGSIHY